MTDHNRWRWRHEQERIEIYTSLFPRICEKLRDDPVRLIEIDESPPERTIAENNAILVPRIKEPEISKSAFVERRRYAR